MSRRANRALLALALVLIGASMLLLNLHTPLMMDDYDYSFSWVTGERLAGVGDIAASQAAHYRLWGGRSVVHFLAQLFLYLGKPVFNLANAAMYLLLLLEMAALAGRRGQGCDGRMMLIAHALMLLAVPFFGTVFLWLDGACNYLWGTALALTPLVILKSEREGGFFDAGFSNGWIAVPVCFLAGWTNENTACGVLAAVLLLTLWDRLRGRKVRAWRWGALAAQALGVAVLLLAPGNFARAGGEASRGMAAELLYRCAVTVYCLLRYAGIPAVLAALALLAARRKGAAVRAEWLCVLAGAALLSACALVGSPQISDRSFTAVLVLAVTALLAVLSDLKAAPDRRSLPALAALTVCIVCVSVFALRDVKAHEAAWHAQTDAMEAAAAAGETDVTASSVPKTSRFTMAIALGKSPDDWPNSTLSRYYGVRVHGQ
ncbi:MAG: DUF6056 family protein [Candidatus Ventricola sp.]